MSYNGFTHGMARLFSGIQRSEFTPPSRLVVHGLDESSVDGSIGILVTVVVVVRSVQAGSVSNDMANVGQDNGLFQLGGGVDVALPEAVDNVVESNIAIA